MSKKNGTKYVLIATNCTGKNGALFEKYTYNFLEGGERERFLTVLTEDDFTEDELKDRLKNGFIQKATKDMKELPEDTFKSDAQLKKEQEEADKKAQEETEANKKAEEEAAAKKKEEEEAAAKKAQEEAEAKKKEEEEAEAKKKAEEEAAAKKAEEDAKTKAEEEAAAKAKELEDLKSEYMELAKTDKVNGNWGVGKLKSEIEKLKANPS